jgi:hypothetical protein
MRIRIQIQGFDDQILEKLQEKSSFLKSEHLALQKLEFSLIFLVILALLDPDPDLCSQCGSGSGSIRPK